MFLHHISYLGQLVHQAHLIVQTPSCIDEHHIGIVGNGRTDRIISHRGRIATHLLLHYWHTNTFAPDTELLNGSCTECIGSTKIDLLTSLLELIGQLADGGGLSHTIHTHNEYHVGLMVGRQLEAFGIVRVVLCQQVGNLFTQDAIEFCCINIFIASHTSFNLLDNLQGCIHAHIRGDEHLFEIVQDLIVDFRFSCYCTCNLTKHALFRLGQSAIQRFLLFLSKPIKESHNILYIMCNVKCNC